jgi:hypothetical protein
MIVQTAKFSCAIFVGSVLAIGLMGSSGASGQSQTQSQTPTAQPPARALANLYEVTKSIINDPSGEAEEHPGGSPTFPYPEAIKLQWDASMVAYGKKLTPQERDQFVPCAAHLNTAIADMEKGYTTEDTQPKSNTGAQADAQKSYAAGKTEFAQCDAAYALAQSEVGNGAASKPQEGGAEANASPEPAPAENPPAAAPEPTPENPPAGMPETPTSGTNAPSNPPLTSSASKASNGPIDGSVEESQEPGSIDWTPTLDPLFTYLSKEWKLVTGNPRNQNWPPDDDAGTLKLKLQPNQPPEMLSVSGNRSSFLRTIMENGNLPVIKFPDGSRLTSVVVLPKFRVKPTPGRTRTRLKYYERDGIFKSYSAPVAE